MVIVTIFMLIKMEKDSFLFFSEFDTIDSIFMGFNVEPTFFDPKFFNSNKGFFINGLWDVAMDVSAKMKCICFTSHVHLESKHI